MLPAICSEVFMQFPDAYGTCHQVLNSLSVNGNNIRYWLFEGCYKYEVRCPKQSPTQRDPPRAHAFHEGACGGESEEELVLGRRAESNASEI